MAADPLTIGFPYCADRFGGSNASSLVLARALDDAGFRIRILAHGEGRALDEAAKLGLETVRLPALSRVPGYARPDRFRLAQMFAFHNCRAAIGELRLDVIHTNDLGMLRTWAAPALSAGATLIAHWRSNFQKSWSVEAGLRVARAVIAVSHYSREKLPHWVQEKTTVEYNPFGLSFSAEGKSAARARVREQLGLPADAAIIGTFGNHIVRKRTHVLADVLHALTETADRRPIYGLACGAEAAPHDTLLHEKIASYGLEQRLLRPGFVRPVEEWISACDVVLAPAIHEPLARSVLEAQALEVPAVVSTDGGLRELIEDGRTGILCDPYDLDDWIFATLAILNDGELADTMARAARQVVSKLEPKRHAERIAAIYRTATGRTTADKEAA